MPLSHQALNTVDSREALDEQGHGLREEDVHLSIFIVIWPSVFPKAQGWELPVPGTLFPHPPPEPRSSVKTEIGDRNICLSVSSANYPATLLGDH